MCNTENWEYRTFCDNCKRNRPLPSEVEVSPKPPAREGGGKPTQAAEPTEAHPVEREVTAANGLPAAGEPQSELLPCPFCAAVLVYDTKIQAYRIDHSATCWQSVTNEHFTEAERGNVSSVEYVWPSDLGYWNKRAGHASVKPISRLTGGSTAAGETYREASGSGAGSGSECLKDLPDDPAEGEKR
jgi:hypothetical protein